MAPGAYLAIHLGLGLAFAAAVGVFVVIAEQVATAGELVAFDLAVARAVRDASTPAWERVFGAVSWLGEREAIAVAAAGVALYLLLTHGVLVAVVWILAQAGGGWLNLALKLAFERTRPPSADPLLAASSWSFPSGHAMGTFILAGLGCYVLLRGHRFRPATGVAVTLALAWCLAMAFSRLYLGEHFLSDVVAGLAAGAAWVAVCASAMEVIHRHQAARATVSRRTKGSNFTEGEAQSSS
jgi:undecaprenyl-diphosphatase